MEAAASDPAVGDAEWRDAGEASVLAATSGEAVEVTSDTTETDRVVANPDGTLTRFMATEPVRALTEDGWQPLDLDLVERDGVLVPNVGAASVSFSAGGSDELVSLTELGQTVTLAWPDTLPVPDVEGATARYDDVFPGVDLLMTATPSGYTQVLEVQDAEAAALPELDSLDLDVQVDGGGDLVPFGEGFAVKDDLGRVAFSSPDSIMWDSSGTEESGAGDDVSAEDVSHAPAEAAAQAPIDVAVADESLTLTPDQDMLDSDDTVFPVFIDPPAVTAYNQALRAMVFKQNPGMSSPNWGNETEHGGQGVGYQNFDGVSTKRLYWQFNVGTKLADAKIFSATFMAKTVWSASCTARPINAYRTAAITTNTNWNNRPGWGALQDTKNISAGNEVCAADKAGDRVLNFDVSAAMQSVANTGDTTVTFGLGADESDPIAWKRFAPKPNDDGEVLAVNYSHAPFNPWSLQLRNPDLACGLGTDRAKIGNDAPAFSAVTNDPQSSQGVKMKFELYRGPWGVDRGTLLKTYATDYHDPNDGPGLSHQYWMQQSDVLAALPRDSAGRIASNTYSWRVQAIDDTGLESEWKWCEFEVDTTRPGTPEIIIPTDAQWILGGTPVQVTFGPGSVDSDDVIKYGWAWNQDSAPTANSATTGVIPIGSGCPAKKCTVNLSIPKGGINKLFLWSYDEVGNPTVYPATKVLEAITVTEQSRYADDATRSPGSPAPAATTAVDNGDAGQHIDLTLTGGTSWWFRGEAFQNPIDNHPVPPSDEYALRFTGNGAAEGPAAKAPTRTNNSFTVSAWIDPSQIGSIRSAVSQVSSTGAVYRLGVDPSCTNASGTYSCYVFALRNPSTGAWVKVQSGVEATTAPGYVHLVGTYRWSEQYAVLYVDGLLSKGAFIGFVPAASTQVILGASKSTTGVVESNFVGDVDHVRLFDGTAGDSDVTVLWGEMSALRNQTSPTTS